MSKEKLWTKRMRAFERSGLSRRAWCEKEGVPLSSLDYWRRRLRTMETAQALVPIVVAEQPLSSKTCLIEIDASGVQLRVPTNIDADWLCRVLRGLR